MTDTRLSRPSIDDPPGAPSEPPTPRPPSADTPTPIRRTRRGLVAIVIIVVILGAELIARALSPTIDPPNDWLIQSMPDHVENINRLEHRGGADVVLLGASEIGTGFDEQALVSRSSLARTAYAAWVSGGSAKAIALFARDVAVPRLHPKVVVIALTSREVNDNSTQQALTYTQLSKSLEIRHIEHRLGTTGALRYYGGRWSTLVRLRGTLRDPAKLRQQLGTPRKNSSMDRFGGLTDRRTRPRAAMTKSKIAQERLALTRFAAGGPELDAVRGLIRDLRGQGIKVLVVNMPVFHDFYVPLHPHGQQDLQRYETAVQSMVRQDDVPFLDADAFGGWVATDFADANHLNGRGAKRLSDLIGAAVDGAARGGG